VAPEGFLFGPFCPSQKALKSDRKAFLKKMVSGGGVLGAAKKKTPHTPATVRAGDTLSSGKTS